MSTLQRSQDNDALLEEGRQAYMQGQFERARELLHPLAEAGDPEAQAWMGSFYANGEGVSVDSGMAFHWYRRSADGGNPKAQANIGAMYAMGQGVEKDPTAAVRWLRRAARNGDPHAQFNMAVLYTKGEGVRESLSKAAEWYLKAAKNGHYPSQARVGHMYYAGQGVKKDRVQAFLWLSLASQHGIGSALTELDKVVEEMSSDEKAKGLELVSYWMLKTRNERDVTVFQPIPG